MTPQNDKGILCTVYRSKRDAGLYIYVKRDEALTRVPPELLEKLGTMSEVLTMKLTPERKLASARSEDVLKAIAEKGFYLQLPPDFNPARFTLGE